MAHGSGVVGNTLVTNGATLEDCHTNVFLLTELTGLKWCRYTAGHSDVEICTDICEDPILRAYSNCWKQDLLCVWRRVPLHRNSSSSHSAFHPSAATAAASKIDLRLAAEKELWVFWYGEEQPAALKTVCASLTKAEEASWDKTVEYETRLLLFKALHNHIERSLLESDYVRLGRWFVQPLSSDEAAHPPRFLLAFNFSFFVHGENNVCVSVTVQRQPPVCRLSRAHLTKREGGRAQKVLLAPFCLAATLSRQCCVNFDTDSQATKLWTEWLQFYPLPEPDNTENMGYIDAAEKERQDQLRALAPPHMVEVVVGGVRLKYPTAFVLVECTTSSGAGGSTGAAGGDKQEQSTSAKLTDSLAASVDSSPEFSGLLLQRAVEELACSASTTNARSGQAGRSTPSSELQQNQEQQQQQPAQDDTAAVWDLVDITEKETCGCGRSLSNSSTSAKAQSPLTPVLNKAQLKFGCTTASNSATSTATAGNSASSSQRHQKLLERQNRIVKSGPFHRRHLLARTNTSKVSSSAAAPSKPSTPLMDAQGSSEMENTAMGRLAVTPVTPMMPATTTITAGGPTTAPVQSAPCSNSLTSPSSTSAKPVQAPTVSAVSNIVLVKSAPPQNTIIAFRDGKRKLDTTRSPRRFLKRPRLTRTAGIGEGERVMNIGHGLCCPDDELNPLTSLEAPFSINTGDWCTKKYQKQELVNPRPFSTPDTPTAPLNGNYFLPMSTIFARHPPGQAVPPHQSQLESLSSSDSATAAVSSPMTTLAPSSPMLASSHNQSIAPTSSHKPTAGVGLPENIMEDSPTEITNEFLSPPPSHGHEDDTAGQHSRTTMANHNAPNLNNTITANSLTSAAAKSRIDYNMIYPTPPSIEQPAVYTLGQFSPDAPTVVVTLPVQRSVSPVHHAGSSSMNCMPPAECISINYTDTICKDPSGVFNHGQSSMGRFQQILTVVETDRLAKYLLADSYSPRMMTNRKNATSAASTAKTASTLAVWRKSEIRRRPLWSSGMPVVQPQIASTSIVRPPSPFFPYSSPLAQQPSTPGSPIAALPPPPSYGVQRGWPSPAAVGSPFSIRASGPRTPASAGCIYDIQSPVSNASSLCPRTDTSVDGAAMIGQTPSSALSIGEGLPAPEGHSLVVSLLLCDTVANLYRDASFDSCPLCVCNMGITGVDAGVYVVASSAVIAAAAATRQSSNCSLQNSKCSCGFSAVRYRYLAWRAGLFYEDEYEATGVWPTSGISHFDQQRDRYSTASELVTLVRYKAGADSSLTENNELAKSRLLNFGSKSKDGSNLSSYILPVIELRDLTEMCNLAVEQACLMMDCTKPSRDDFRSHPAYAGGAAGAIAGTANKYFVAEWGYMRATRPATNGEACFVMRLLSPILQESMQKSRGGGSMQISRQQHGTTVEGPLSWRQLHRKCIHRTTNDLSGPEPVPLLLLATDRDWITVSPFGLRWWDRLALEPYGQQKDVVYLALVPDNPMVIQRSRTFFRSLSRTYEGLRLGRHCPVTRIVKDGIMPIRRSYVKQLNDASVDSSSIDQAFDQIVERSPKLGARLKLCAQICRHYLSSYLVAENVFDKSIFRDIGKETGASDTSTSMPPPSMIPGRDSQEITAGSNANASETEGGLENAETDGSAAPHVVVVYFVDAFTFGPADREDNQFCRLAASGLYRCYLEVLRELPDAEKARVQLEVIPLENILETELVDAVSGCSRAGYLRQLAFSVFKQPRWLDFGCIQPLVAKPLTGFGTAASRLELIRRKAMQQKDGARLGSYYQAHCPPVVLAPTFDKATVGSNPDVREDSCRVLFISYCLSENQDWLIASATDHQGCVLEDCIIDLRVNNRRCITRRPVCSTANGGSFDQGPEGSMIWESLRKLWNFVMALLGSATHPWRLVIGRLGRLGHEELKAWAHFLCRAKLRATSRLIRERCGMCATLPAFHDATTILSACLISTEPDPSLRLFPNAFTHDDRFGQGGKHCPLSTPEDVSCTHIMVFPTSAAIHMSQSAIPGGMGVGQEEEPDIGDFPDFFDTIVGEDVDNLFEDDIMNEPGKSFHHTQETGDESIQLQPLALGYLVSTAPSGWLPDWFWTNRPSGRSEVPVHLRSSLHIHTSGVQQNDEQLLPATSTSAAAGGGSRNAANTHPLDSSLTTDVLRYVLETYNSLSWLTFEAGTGDRRTCMPVHVEHLCRLYRAMNGLDPSASSS